MPRYTQYSQDVKAKKYLIKGYKRWIDPFPGIEGTLPEKIVIAAMFARGIRIAIQNELTFSRADIDFFQNYRPDIVLPDQKVIIEVQGAYFHSKAGAFENDAYKAAVYELFGYRVLAWWDYEIEQDVNALFLRDLPGFNVLGYYKNTEVLVGRKVTRDDGKGVATLNRKRGQRLSYRKKAVGVKMKKSKTITSYNIYGK